MFSKSDNSAAEKLKDALFNNTTSTVGYGVDSDVAFNDSQETIAYEMSAEDLPDVPHIPDDSEVLSNHSQDQVFTLPNDQDTDVLGNSHKLYNESSPMPEFTNGYQEKCFHDLRDSTFLFNLIQNLDEEDCLSDFMDLVKSLSEGSLPVKNIAVL